MEKIAVPDCPDCEYIDQPCVLDRSVHFLQMVHLAIVSTGVQRYALASVEAPEPKPQVLVCIGLPI